MIEKAVDQSIRFNKLIVLIGIDWHRSIDDQSVVTQKLFIHTQTSQHKAYSALHALLPLLVTVLECSSKCRPN